MTQGRIMGKKGGTRWRRRIWKSWGFMFLSLVTQSWSRVMPTLLIGRCMNPIHHNMKGLLIMLVRDLESWRQNCVRILGIGEVPVLFPARGGHCWGSENEIVPSWLLDALSCPLGTCSWQELSYNYNILGTSSWCPIAFLGFSHFWVYWVGHKRGHRDRFGWE